jgi:ATP-dependent Zn protease
VVGRRFGYKVDFVDIAVDRNKSRGGTTQAWTPNDGKNLNGLHFAAVALAGGLAEEMQGYTSAEGMQEDVASCFAIAWIVLAHRRGNDSLSTDTLKQLTENYLHHPEIIPPEVKRVANEMIGKATPIAKGILKKHWSAVERIASLLIKHKAVDIQKLNFGT